MLQIGTALIAAAQQGHLEVVKALVVHGAGVDFSDDGVRCFRPMVCH